MAYDPARTARYLARVARETGVPGFRLAETPVFFDRTFVARARAAAEAIIGQLDESGTRVRLEGALPPDHPQIADRPALPNVAVLDFAVTRRKDGSLAPKLVELQGFPSLVLFECIQGDAWIEALGEIRGCEGPWTYADGGRAGLLELARATIVGDADPSECVLLDVEPERQKTLCDFRATERLLGVAAVDPRALERRGARLFRRDAAGRRVPVRRIYHRLIATDLPRAGRPWPEVLRGSLDVAWIAHPDYYYLWSKYALPLLDHESVPRTRLLSEVEPGELDLAGQVLKPLFLFAGGGVVLEPSLDDLAAVPPEEREAWCLQERIAYTGAVASPAGDVKLEVRLMYLRPEGEPELRYATNLCRLSRGAMIGVDYNRDLPWTGSSIGLLRAGDSTVADGS